MKTFSELEIGDKIFIWDHYKKIADIGIVTNIIRTTECVVWYYDSMFEENSSTIRSITLNLIHCIGAYTYTYNIRSLYSYYFVSTYIEPILNFIEENENI